MKRIIFTLTFLSCIHLTYCQPETSRDVLHLHKALEIVKDNNLTLKQQVERINQATRELHIQKAGLFPKIFANGSYNFISEIPKLKLVSTPIDISAGANNQYDINIQIQQPIFTGFRSLNLIKAANEDLKIKRSQSRSILNQILYQIHNIFYSAQLNQLQQKVLQASLERAHKDLTTTINFYEAAQISAFDTLRVANQYLDIITHLNRLTHEYEVILTQLAVVLNLSDVKEVQPFSETEFTLSLESVDTYTDMAFKNRPELTEIYHKIRSQGYFKKSINAFYFPQVHGQASYHYGKPGVNFFENKWMDYFTIGLNLHWEIWNMGRRKNQIEQTKYAINILTIEQEKILDIVKKEVKQAYENLLTDIDQIALTEQLFIQEKERYRIINEKYNQGLATTLDLTEAENALTTAELRLQQNKINWLIDNAYMKFVCGQLDMDLSQ